MSTELVTTDEGEIEKPKKRKVVTEAQAQKALAAAEVDKSISVLRQIARGDFGQWAVDNAIGPVLITSDFHNLEQANNAAKIGLEMARDAFIPPETKVKACLMVVQAAKAATEITKSLRETARVCGIVEAKQTPKFAPPNLAISATGDVHIHEQGGN